MARRAADFQAAADGIDAVDQADAVVGDGHDECVAAARHAHADGVGPGVLRNVGESLGDDEVSGRLDGRVESLRDHGAQVDRHRRPLDECGQGRFETTVGEHRRVDAARQIAQLGKAAVELFPCPGQDGPRALGVTLEPLVEHRQLERGGDESLLCPIVQVALDPPPCLRRGRRG
jgi:hypothetical protein